MKRSVSLLVFISFRLISFSQEIHPHVNAHSHNDYENPQPLIHAYNKGFMSVEADVHLVNGRLRVSHNAPDSKARLLSELYLRPLDSIAAIQRSTNPKYGSFFLMIDIKTEAEVTYRTLDQLLRGYNLLTCLNADHNCPVVIFLSGNRPVDLIIKDPNSRIALDGRPSDLGKNYPTHKMPVISDNFNNWSSWNGKSKPADGALDRIKDLAKRVHAEGKKLRLWAIPDNELAWQTLLDTGVDLINTDHIDELDKFLTEKGL
ncbi:MAG: hypothetical protein HOP08_09275 [Cyclobacteriaceae bacterium]|nr:hypothetical protein [Cyclobacteriaceae bacterium]